MIEEYNADYADKLMSGMEALVTLYQISNSIGVGTDGTPARIGSISNHTVIRIRFDIKRQSWTASGLFSNNGSSYAFQSVEYGQAGFDVKPPYTYDKDYSPRKGNIVIWGHLFNFDKTGAIFDADTGIRSGFLTLIK
jgi:hypothetical protein